MTSRLIVRVPASTSNLGAGFDCVGVAVDRWLTVGARRDGVSETPRIVREGTLEAIAPAPERDLIWCGLAAACEAGGREPPRGIIIEASSEIPIGRGLGSSAAAVVAGIVVANALFGLGLDAHAIATIGTSIEGHPDNVVPAVFGGAMLAIAPPDAPLVVSPLDVHEALAFVFAIPDFILETRAARRALPAAVPHAIAVAAAARSAALVRGLATGDGALLAVALADVLHVPYRRGLIRGYDDVATAACQAGAFGATLSGAGSGMVAIAPAGSGAQVASAMAAAWSEHKVDVMTFRMTRPVGGYEIQELSAQ